MKRSEILELSNQLSERKGEKVLSLPLLYTFVLQDICKRQRFWWRRVLVSFALTANTKTYDLTDVVLFPSLTEIALDEITKFTLILAPSPLQKAELTPVFDPETLIEMTINTSATQPSRYTMEQGDFKKLRIDPPDKAYSAYIVGWGMPNPATDTTSDTVPLIPAWGHNTVVMGMVAYIFTFAYGSSNQKSVDAIAKYEQSLEDLMQRKQFDPNYVSQLTLSGDAVRST